MRHLFLLYCFFISVHLNAQNVKTPDQFLGYTLGEKFTYHHKIVSYFKEIYASVPAKVKLENYGYTNEGRDLMIAIVSSPENISRIDDIRKNNLRLAGLLKDKPGEVDMPAVIWLSYNVHGNEASSSEVSMKTLYELVSGNNAEIKIWLKNSVVIIDPCLNPDGRDRYVNWYNQVVGSAPVANILSREHDEPWPGGRTNHYNFDLNRDWAWQTQIETQQRVSKYNEWMPSIHCDYHEQSYASPYYFAPAAEPYHEV
ncbi:MAG: zinc carboxypeptidase, partial [Ferruginibacter sp.]|nr:zinc carboxypeptidase [Ferruginibacter sp.]